MHGRNSTRSKSGPDTDSFHLETKEGSPGRPKIISKSTNANGVKPRLLNKPSARKGGLHRSASTSRATEFASAGDKEHFSEPDNPPPDPQVDFSSNNVAVVNSLVEKLESLTGRHESLLVKHEALGYRHEELMSRHESLLGALEVLVQRQGKATADVVAAAQALPNTQPSKGSSAPRVRPMGTNSANASPMRSSVSEPRGGNASSSSSSSTRSRPGTLSGLLKRSVTRKEKTTTTTKHAPQQRSSTTSSPTRHHQQATQRHHSPLPDHHHHLATKRTSNHQPAADYGLRVVVRKRPAVEGDVDCVECFGDEGTVLVHEDKVKVDLTKYVQTHTFTYDDCYGEGDSTAAVYERSISNHLMDNFFDGGTSTCFCFGQTASGKTFTLFGAGGGQAQSSLDDDDDDGPTPRVSPTSALTVAEDDGLYVIAAKEAFVRLRAFKAKRQQSATNPLRGELVLTVSMFEIYGQKVRDLLNESAELAALEDGKGVLQLVGLTAAECESFEEFLHVSHVGRSARSTSATGANATSSRSHAALLLRLVDRAAPTAGGGEGASTVLGKFSLIDLAGSERGVDHESSDKQTQMEGRQINQSLLALKEVIRAKELGRHHAPFRQSRLTQVLEESLTGARCHTTVIGCISPAQRDTQQTVNTLRYAESLSPHSSRHRRTPVTSGADVTSPSVEEDGDAARASLTEGEAASQSSPPPIRSRRSSFEMMTLEFEGGDEALLGAPTPQHGGDGDSQSGNARAFL